MSKSIMDNNNRKAGNFFSRLFGQTKNQQQNWSKEDNEKKMEEYSFIIGNFVANIADFDRAGLKELVASYLQEKEQNYTGLAYLEQIEKNYVYHECIVPAMIDHINMFLLGQIKAPKIGHWDLELNRIRLTTRDESSAHMRYLTFDCDGCGYHNDHARYSGLRQLRLTDMNGYLDEMEFGFQFYTAGTLLCQMTLKSLWQKPEQFRGSFDWDKINMDDILFLYIKNATSAVINNKPLRDENGELLNIIVID